MVQRYEQTRKLQWYKRGAAYFTLTVPIEQPTSECTASQLFFIRLYTISG